MKSQMLLFLSIILISIILGLIAVFSITHGQDAGLFCSAARAAQLGKNPYDVQNLGLRLSWNYQPYLLPLFGVLCPPPIRFEDSYPYIYTILVIGGIAILSLKSDRFLALVLILGGFWGFGWTLLTGNITALEFLLVSTAIVLLENRRWEVAGLVLSIMASIKLLTIIYVGLLLFIPESNPRRVRVFIISVLVFALTFGLSYMLYPKLFVPFLEQVFGLIPNQHNVWMETGKLNNLPLAFFLMDTLALFGVIFPSTVSTVLGTAISIVIVFWIYRKTNLIRLARENYMIFFSLGFIASTLILPRLKPYSFLMLIPALFYLIRSQGKGRQILVVAVSTILPFVIFFIRLFSVTNNSVGMLLLTYSQTIFLLFTFAILVYFVNHPERIDHARIA